ncbi:SDR family NAD(P)-dependent oxidoreductase [Halobacterium bonnevillei]|uniref:SDR family NAD(P)-dependent oxidoreductase n=1 Tax=Halobacterium bonnevillei TaxID=2692200 RepID=UPI001916C851|nr:glucose 1-dehydrogenase [Halobacterium bonnevillei]
MSGKLSGDTAIVTGSSSGLGRAIAEGFAAEGANVVTNSRAEERAADTAEAIREAGGNAVAAEADVSDKADVEALVEAAVEEYGSLDVMVNNAGTTVEKHVFDQTPEDWQHVLDVNLTGTFYGSQVAGEQMADQGTGGHIINVSSIYGSIGVQGRAPYNATKAGIENLTRCLAVELAEYDVHVNALAPGYIKTELAEAPWGEEITEDRDWPYYGYTEEHITNRTPLDRFGTFEEVSNCATFLAAGDHYVTGEVLHNDGGWLAFGWGSKA